MKQGISSDSYRHKRKGIIPDSENDDFNKWEFSQSLTEFLSLRCIMQQGIYPIE